MKTDLKIKLIYVSTVVLVIIGIAFIWYTNDKSKHGTSKSITNQMEQDLAMGSSKGLLSNPSLNSESTSNQLTDQKLVNQAQNGKQIKKVVADANSSGRVLQVTNESRETPAELYQRWLNVTSSSEFKEYAHSVVDPLFDGKSIELTDKIGELENKERELINSLETSPRDQRSKIQFELERVREDLWETKVLRSEKLTLVADAIWLVHLRYFTNDELLTVRKEIGRTQPAPSLPSNPDKDRDKMVKAEAMARLKASGWVPASPDESWY